MSGLTLGDYLLWNWSLSGSHDALALVSGLTLPALSIAWVWLLALSVARLIASYGRRSRALAGEQVHRGDASRKPAGPAEAVDGSSLTADPGDRDPAPVTSSAPPSSGKLAA